MNTYRINQLFNDLTSDISNIYNFYFNEMYKNSFIDKANSKHCKSLKNYIYTNLLEVRYSKYIAFAYQYYFASFANSYNFENVQSTLSAYELQNELKQFSIKELNKLSELLETYFLNK